MIQPQAAVPVEVFHEGSGERNRYREPVTDRPAGRDPRDRVLHERRRDERVGVQRLDQLDFFRAWLLDGTAQPDRKAECVRAAQDDMARYSQAVPDFRGRHPQVPVQFAQDIGRYGTALLTVPSAPGADAEAVAVQAVTDGAFGNAEKYPDLVFFVTHLFDLAHGFYAEKREIALFLRPERREDGKRTFRLLEGEPLPTSYGPDLYRQIFGAVAGRG